MNWFLWVWALIVTGWRLSFKAVPLDITSPGLCRDAGHFLLGALGYRWIDQFNQAFYNYRVIWGRPPLVSAGRAFLDVCGTPAFVVFWWLTILEGGMFLAFGNV